MTADNNAALAVAAGQAVTASAERPLATSPVPITGVLSAEKEREWFDNYVAKWEELPEEVRDAMILMRRPFTASGGGVYFLLSYQALMVVRYCKAKGIDVHADTWFFDPKYVRVNSTVSGLRQEARARKIDLGAPVCTPRTRPWPAGKPRIKGFDGDDIGYHCEMTIGDKAAPASCEVWLSTAFRDTSNWRDNTDHMLQVRAIGTCTKFAMGSGISQMPDDVDDKEEK